MNTNQTGRGQKPAGQGSRADNVKSSSQKRKKRSHKKNGVVYIMLILLVIAAGVGLSFTVIFNTQSIVVENAAVRYSDEAIIAASGITVGDNMPSMRVKRIAEKIEKELPYIGSVRIKRSINGTVTITAEYTRASAVLPYGNGYVLLNSAGKVLETGVREPADYIAEITGAQIESAVPGEKAVLNDDDTFTYLTGLLTDFENAGFRNVTAIDISDINSVSAEIDYRITVKFGGISKASAKLKFGKKVIDESLANTAAGRLVVDLTQDGTAYVRSRENIDAAEKAAEKIASEETFAPAPEDGAAGEAPAGDGAAAEEEAPGEAQNAPAG